MIRSIFTLLAALVLISGCEQGPPKTDSMLYREQAAKEVARFVALAEAQLNEEVTAHPLEHLDSWIIVHNNVKDGLAMYKKRQIVNWQDEGLSALQTQLEQLEPQLVEHGFFLLDDLIQRTLVLRKAIEDAKTQPLGAESMNREELVAFLADRYNKDIEDCCLVTLGRIDKLLTRNLKTHRPLIKAIRNVHGELENVIRDATHASVLRAQILEMQFEYEEL